MTRSWLITGGCGFIGVNLVRLLKGNGHGLRVFDNLSAGSRDDLRAVTEFRETDEPAGAPSAGAVELVVGDVRDGEALARAAAACDVVVHLAAQTGVIPSVEDPHTDCEINVIGTLNALTAARGAGAGRFVMASSGAPLGEQDPPVHEGLVPRPLSPYGASKAAGEMYCSAFQGSFGLDTVALRFSNVYGPYSFKKGSVIALFFRLALAGKPLVIYGDGEQTRDFIHTDDLCRAIMRGAEAEDAGGQVFQVATGRETSVNALTAKIRGLVERDLKRPVEVVHEPARPGEIIRNVSDISKARRVLGFEPQVDLDAGLAETWGWFRSRP